MKSKVKPAKGSARTKRFDVGGTVGALAGLGTLAYLMSRKKKGADESSDVAARRASGAYRGGAGTDTTTDTKTDTTSDTTTDNKPFVKPPSGVIFEEDRQREDARQRALKQSKGKGELVPEGADRKELYSDVNARRTDIAPVVKKKKDASAYTGQGMAGSDKGGKKKAGADNAPAYTGQGMAGSDTGAKKEPPVLKAGESEAEAKARKAADRQKFLQSQAGINRRGIATPGKDKNRQERSKGRSANPIQETIDNAGKSMARTPQQKMSERAREVQRRREEEMKSRYKKGGAVKKYANGGSVMASKMGSVKTAKPSMRSASSRADGIAQRGKTRA